MIQVKNLKRTYISKKKVQSRGLVDVSFDLPSKGFVIVLGKSGSGKSTLLNLLGKLDEKTEGKIYIDGKDMDTFTKEEIDFYRSTYCGFIFQDYQLINELTVKENIALSLELISDNEKKEERVQEIIKRVELEGFENRYPTELSGGQKQRVSIARALIKNPKLILCDEPTGNLDKKTSKAILDLLQEISQSCLVFMVSHDERNSLKYAQRRIILEEGYVIKDEYRDEAYKNEFYIEDNKAYLPFEKEISDKDCDILVEKIKRGEVDKLCKLGNGFEDNKKTIKEDTKFEYKKEKFDKKSFNKINKTYLKSGMMPSMFNAILFSLLTVLLILIESFLSFKTENVYYDNMDLEERDSLVIANVDDNFANYYNLTEEDENNLFSDLNCKKYKVYNYTPSTTSYSSHYQIDAGIVKKVEKYFNQHGVYPAIAIGTAVVDEEYLLNRYKNENGELEVLAGSLDDCKDSLHLILTDFLADAILDTLYEYNSNYTYEDILGPQEACLQESRPFSKYNVVNIVCVIMTNYREKYKTIFDKYEIVKEKDFPYTETEEILDSEDFFEYYNDIINGELSLCFSLNQNFYNQYVEESTSDREYTRLGKMYFSLDEKVDRSDVNFETGCVVVDEKINDGEIYIREEDRTLYEAFFGTSELIGKEIYIIRTKGNALDGDVIDSIKLTIAGFKKNNNGASKETVRRLSAMQLLNYAYLVSIDTEDIEKIFANTVEHNYTILDLNIRVYNLVGKTLLMFGDIFRLIEIVLVVVLVALFASYSIRTVKSKFYQIGVFKSLGMPDKNIRSIFLSKNALFSVTSLVLTTALINPFFSLSNSLIIQAYSKFLDITLKQLNIFYFHSIVFIVVYLLLILIFIVFTLIPLFMIKKVSPAKIVNNKNE